ncbi:error-prone DNA polymerase [Methylocystis parvus]|uniref:Error-prone DNA polymerase n=3 Tax=Methylocystis parvus TaxID=134 RepID=A0A6B8MEJ1_9HYPH|nr:error-prone DNA polymerase [Methylocystis parvus]QGM99060.1 DNA polymerase III subunit alpha [Methylocystis parvus]WBK00572.1 error-prone DNA polymerase [Methylocystis parvus OBBP]
MSAPRYAELAATTNFSFLRGASHPEEMAATAVALGHCGVGIADRNSLAGVVRAFSYLRAHEKSVGDFRLAVGARLVFRDETPDILCYPKDRAAYGRLCRLLTCGNMRTQKGDCALFLADLLDFAEGQHLILMENGAPPPALMEAARDRIWLAATALYGPRPRARLFGRIELADELALPLVAVNDAHMHVPGRRPLADALTCIREKTTLDAAGFLLAANAERHLKSAEEMARLFRDAPHAVEESARFIEALDFRLTDVAYEYPSELREDFASEQEALAFYAREGAKARYSEDVPEHVTALLERELALVAKLKYAAYFLTVHDIMRFARSEGILAQGRGSAANSLICYCLDITKVDPTKHNFLFERFVSTDRNEPPDIDVDFEHERREEVIQYIYRRFKRERAGIAAAVITYRGKSAIREIGKVFGLSGDLVGRLSSAAFGRGSERETRMQDIARLGLDVSEPRFAKALALAEEIEGFPRHLTQHSGGFVISRDRLDEVVPILPTAMEGRTAIEWDKDDLDALGLLKVDVLALGMLTCLRRGLDLLARHYRIVHSLSTLSDEEEDKRVYAMISRADTIGVFQIESRAQMSMLPRLRPQCFYDLVIEVAIVRPGPIQGDMVHPYLRRRMGKDPVSYPSKELEEVLAKTHGVPLFQEQAMRIAIVAAGFTPSEADQLRRAMATFKRAGLIGGFRDKMITGMTRKGYARDFAERCFSQIEGFGAYGFPESHAASFALLVYASAWLKCRYPDVFACALLNAQPMGFYAPAQIVRDANEHGVEVREPDINASDWDCTLEAGEPHPSRFARHPPRKGEGWGCIAAGDHDLEEHERLKAIHNLAAPIPPPRGEGGARSATGGGQPRMQGESLASIHPRHADMAHDILGNHAVRLGFRQIRGVAEEDMRRLVVRRGKGYDSVRDVWLRAELSPATLTRLAEADAFASLGLSRRDALWAAAGLNRAGDKDDLPLLRELSFTPLEPDANLPPMPPGEEIVEDYRFLSLSLKGHPVAFLRDRLAARRVLPCEALSHFPDGSGRRVTVGGIVLLRQRPGTAKGVVFMTIEDETGQANIIVWPKLLERQRAEIIGARYVAVAGRLQKEAGVIHVIADRVDDLSSDLRLLETMRIAKGEAMPKARNFH